MDRVEGVDGIDSESIDRKNDRNWGTYWKQRIPLLRQRSNQLNYVPTRQIRDLLKSLAGQGFCKLRIPRTLCRLCLRWQLSLPQPPI